MKVNYNGIVRDLTPEEIAEMERMAAEMPAPEPTSEERLQALEAQNEALIDKLRAALILLGLED